MVHQRGTYNCDEVFPQTGCPRTIKGGCSLSMHAEYNAILFALIQHANIKNSILYITLSPCLPCARLIFSVGIKTVIYKDYYAVYKKLEQEEGLDFINEFGVVVRQYDPCSGAIL